MRIDANEAVSLAALIRRDVAAIQDLIQHGRRLTGDSGTLDRVQIESLGYTMHNIYNALENSFTQISLSFENHVKDRERWHRELLDKMFLDLRPLRPELLTPEFRSILNELLAFRHMFRHAYDFELDQERVLRLWSSFNSRAPAILACVEAFVQALESLGAKAGPESR